MKRLIASILIIAGLIFNLTTIAYASDDILVVLEQPAVYKANENDSLDYNLLVELPKDYNKKYRSFAVSILMDSNLKVEGTKFVGIDPVDSKISLNKTEVKDGNQDLISVSINDTEALGSAEKFKVNIKTRVKKAASGDSFNNSFVLTYVDRQGNENSVQKNLISNTKLENQESILDVNSIYTNSKVVQGKANPEANIAILKDGKEIAKTKADKDGKFSIKIDKQKIGTEILVKSNYKINGADFSIDKKFVVKDAEEQYDSNSMVDDSLIGTKKENMEILDDYVKMAKLINISKANKEDSARLVAAIANGQYIQIKSDLKSDDITDAIKKIKEATAFLRSPIMKGYTDNTFGVNKKMTRAETAAVLATIDNGGKSPVGYFSDFKDVEQADWFADSVGYVQKQGIFGGYENNTFKPTKSITRAEFAKVIANFKGLEADEEGQSFKDVKDNFWAKDAIEAVSANGYMNGRGNNKFYPNEAITRAEVATVLNKILDRTPNEEFIDKYSKNPFKDLKKDHWSYYQVMEISGN